MTVWILTDERYLAQRMPAALITWLNGAGAETRFIVAERQMAEVGGPGPWDELAPGDLVAARTRNRFGLALLREATTPGVTVATPWDAVTAIRNKPRAVSRMAAAGIPMPRTWLANRPAMLRSIPRTCYPLILKPHLGDNAQGIVVLGDPADIDDLDWTDGMTLAQRYVDAGGVDLKLYVAGERVWAVRRASPLNGSKRPTEQVAVDRELRDLAAACRRLFGLDLLGIDVLESRSGPLVVDVNDFPNYTGVDGAPEAVGRLLLQDMTHFGSRPMTRPVASLVCRHAFRGVRADVGLGSLTSPHPCPPAGMEAPSCAY
jgi:ribosomal protein S6--L-glutamate ligase